MINIEEFEARLAVDKDGLDDELAQQPELFYHVARAARQMAVDRDAMKDTIREVSAQVAKEVRDAAEADGEKVTEAKINERVLSHRKVMLAQADYRELCKESARWSALEDAFNQKSHSLKSLADLYGTIHYQTDSAKGGPGVAHREYEKVREEIAQAREARGRPAPKGKKRKAL